mgnify:CR=1 FL=1
MGTLALVAVLLARESKGLLIGERADPAIIATIRRIVAAHPAIISVNHVRTIHTAPDEVVSAGWLAMRVGSRRFSDGDRESVMIPSFVDPAPIFTVAPDRRQA